MVPYTLIRSRRKTLALEVMPDGTVKVRAPLKLSNRKIQEFILEKEDWLLAAIHKQKQRQKEREETTDLLSLSELNALKDKARLELPDRVSYYASKLNVTYGRITIRSQKSRWGSCSSKGNLNFNCLLMLTPQDIQDYVIIHELCHRLQMNHSASFWANVESLCPNYKEKRKWLKKHSSSLISRLPS